MSKFRLTRRAVTLPMAALAGALLLAACASTATDTEPSATTPTGPVSGELVVFAAASLTEVFTQLEQRFENTHPDVDVILSFGGSSSLATQITAGAPADVFASASTTVMQQVVDSGDAATDPRIFARNLMEVALPLGNPGGVQDLQDLENPDVKVAVCQPEVPCGAAAQQVFENAGLSVTPVTLEPDVKFVVNKVLHDEVDAGIVYVTDVQAAGDDIEWVPVPFADNVTTEHPITVLADSGNPRAAAAWVGLVLSPQGKAALSRAGFLQ